MRLPHIAAILPVLWIGACKGPVLESEQGAPAEVVPGGEEPRTLPVAGAEGAAGRPAGFESLPVAGAQPPAEVQDSEVEEPVIQAPEPEAQPVEDEEPEPTEPKTEEPETQEPEAAEPEVAEPEVVAPEPDPEVVAPEQPEPVETTPPEEPAEEAELSDPEAEEQAVPETETEDPEPPETEEFVEPQAQPEESAEEEKDPWIRGHLSARYRGRWRSGEEDHDLTTTLYADAGDEERDTWTYHLLGSVFADLDGLADPDESLFGLDDTHDDQVQGRAYHAYADRHGDGAIERVRIGRQLDYDTPELAWFDGISLVAAERGEKQVTGGVYGGIPVHSYESSPDGDLIAGVWAESRPWKDGRVRVDWMHIEDEYLAQDHEDDLASIELWQSLGRELRVEGGYSMLDGEERDLRAAATLMSAGGNLVLRATLYKLLATQRSQAIETDPFFNSLQELHPFEQLRVLLSGNLGDAVVLEGGVDLRRVTDDGDVGEFNRDFDRTFLTATLLQGLPWDLEASLTWDQYDSEDTDTRVLGADLSRELGEGFETSVGTYYSLFKYDLFLNQERDDVRTWYLRMRRKLSERTRLDVRYEYEDDELEDYHTFRVGTTWRF